MSERTKLAWFFSAVIVLAIGAAVLTGATGSQILFTNGTAPGNPVSGKTSVYVNSGTGYLTCLNSSGATPCISTTSGTVTSVGLSKTNDTNVTATVTGSPITTSGTINLALGWTGQLGVSRGGIGVGTLTGIAKGNGTSAFTAAASTDVVGLFSGCSGTQYLGADGSCHTPSSGGITVGTTTISSGTNTRVLYNNSGVVGEYQLNGSGKVCMDTGSTCAGGSGGISVSGYYLTDGTHYYIGPTWYQATLPNTGSFSWLSTQGGATFTASNNAAVLYAPAASGDHIRAVGQNIGANTTLDVAFGVSSAVSNFTNVGIALKESGTGKYRTFTLNTYSGTLALSSWNSDTSFNSTTGVVAASLFCPTCINLFRIVMTGSQIQFWWIPDWHNPFLLVSAAYTDFFTTAPDQWGVYANTVNSGANGDAYLTVYTYNPH